MSALSDALLEFLEEHPGEAFTADELFESIPWPGRVYSSHVQQALERRLLPERLVLAEGDLRQEGKFVKSDPATRWFAVEGAPAGLVAYVPGEGLCRCDWMSG